MRKQESQQSAYCSVHLARRDGSCQETQTHHMSQQLGRDRLSMQASHEACELLEVSLLHEVAAQPEVGEGGEVVPVGVVAGLGVGQHLVVALAVVAGPRVL